MHPLLVLVAFAIGAVVTYGVVLALLTATSAVPADRGEGQGPGQGPEEPALRHDGEHACP